MIDFTVKHIFYYHRHVCMKFFPTSFLAVLGLNFSMKYIKAMTVAMVAIFTAYQRTWQINQVAVQWEFCNGTLTEQRAACDFCVCFKLSLVKLRSFRYLDIKLAWSRVDCDHNTEPKHKGREHKANEQINLLKYELKGNRGLCDVQSSILQI